MNTKQAAVIKSALAAAAIAAAVIWAQRSSQSPVAPAGVLCGLAVWSLRCKQETKKLMQIEERAPLGRDAQILLLRLNAGCAEQLLISVTKERVQLLGTLIGRKLSLNRCSGAECRHCECGRRLEDAEPTEER